MRHGSARVGSEHTHAPGTKITLQATQTGLMDRLDAQNRGVVLLHAELHAPTEKNAMACAQQNRQKQTKLKAGMQGGGLVAHLVPKTRRQQPEGSTTGLPCVARDSLRAANWSSWPQMRWHPGETCG